MESEPMLTPREKSPLSEKFSSEDWTHSTGSNRTASPTHYQWTIPAPPKTRLRWSYEVALYEDWGFMESSCLGTCSIGLDKLRQIVSLPTHSLHDKVDNPGSKMCGFALWLKFVFGLYYTLSDFNLSNHCSTCHAKAGLCVIEWDVVFSPSLCL